MACSAAALAAALSSAGEGATLTLAPRCTYRLTAGLPAISEDLSIVGHGATLQRSTAPGTPKFAIIKVSEGGLTVSDLNFSGNKGAGAITDNSPGSGPRVNGATFTRNTTTGDGVAIYDDTDAGGATVTNSAFYGNTAAGSGGAIMDAAQDPGMFSRDLIYDNRAGVEGGGIADADFSSIENSRIFGNRASVGGGLFVLSVDMVTVTGTSIWGNSAKDGGAIYTVGAQPESSLQLTNDKITGNYASADGGGIYNEAGAFPIGVLTLAHTTVSANDAGSLGGGIYNAGAVAAADTTISRNTARGGGGIYQIEGDGYGVRLTRSAVLHNIPDNCEPPGTIMGCTG